MNIVSNGVVVNDLLTNKGLNNNVYMVPSGINHTDFYFYSTTNPGTLIDKISV